MIKLIDAATLFFESFVDFGPHAREFFELMTDGEFEDERKMWEPVIEVNASRTIEEIKAEWVLEAKVSDQRDVLLDSFGLGNYKGLIVYVTEQQNDRRRRFIQNV